MDVMRRGRATRNQVNVIVAPPGPFTDVDVTMKFKPISGQEDASGGIVFRFNDGKYYVVRANALGQWHTVRLVAVGDRMQAWLDGKQYLDHRDARLRSGAWGSGRRPTPSPPSTTSRSAV